MRLHGHNSGSVGRIRAYLSTLCKMVVLELRGGRVAPRARGTVGRVSVFIKLLDSCCVGSHARNLGFRSSSVWSTNMADIF